MGYAAFDPSVVTVNRESGERERECPLDSQIRVEKDYGQEVSMITEQFEQNRLGCLSIAAQRPVCASE